MWIRCFYVAVLLVLAFDANANPAMQASADDSLIRSVSTLLEQKKPKEALALCEAAAREQPSRWQPRIYAGMAYLHLADYARAEECFTQASERADGTEAKEEISKAKSGAASLAIASAEQSLANGLKAKAAADLEAAFRLNPVDTDTGFRAARLWTELKEYWYAAAMLNSLVQNDSAVIADQAQQLLTGMDAELEARFSRAVDQVQALAQENKLQEAEELANLLARVYPKQGEFHAFLLWRCVDSNNLTAFRRRLVNAAKAQLNAEQLANSIVQLKLFGLTQKIASDSVWEKCLADTLGPSAPKLISYASAEPMRRNDEDQARAAQQAAAESARLQTEAAAKLKSDELKRAKAELVEDLSGTWRFKRAWSDYEPKVEVTQRGDFIEIYDGTRQVFSGSVTGGKLSGDFYRTWSGSQARKCANRNCGCAIDDWDDWTEETRSTYVEQEGRRITGETLTKIAVHDEEMEILQFGGVRYSSVCRFDQDTQRFSLYRETGPGGKQLPPRW